MKRCHLIAVLFLTGPWAACGSSSSSTPTPTPTPTVPTISSVTGISSGTSTSATIAATGSTAISTLASNPLTITFSTAMDTSTITTSNIGLSCGGTAQTITIANSNSSTNTTFTVTPPANITQVTSCTLTIGTGVQSSDGGALASAATYVYTTGCTLNDNFATDTVTGGCWTPYSGNDGTISVTGGTLVETITTTEGVISEQKTITPGGSMVAIVSIPTFSGIENGGGGLTSNCALFVGNSSFETVISIDIERSDLGDLKVNVVTSATVATADLGVNGTSSSALSGTLYFKIVQVSDTTFTAHYSLDGSSYTQVGGTITGGVVLGSAPIISLFAANHVADTTTSCSFANFSLTGATVSGQD